jgi:hypothetical protein
VGIGTSTARRKSKVKSQKGLILGSLAVMKW